jgi:hypothetical protein
MCPLSCPPWGSHNQKPPPSLTYLCYTIYNPALVHVVFQEDIPSFNTSTPIDSVIANASDTSSDHNHSPQSHPLDTSDADDTSHMPYAPRPHRLRSHPVCYGELVAHLSDYPPVRITTCCDPEQGKAKEDIVEHPNVAQLVICSTHHSTGASDSAIDLLPVKRRCRVDVVPCCPLKCISAGMARSDAT